MDSMTFLVERCCEAYAAVADWQGLQQWLQDIKVSQLLTVAVCHCALMHQCLLKISVLVLKQY